MPDTPRTTAPLDPALVNQLRRGSPGQRPHPLEPTLDELVHELDAAWRVVDGARWNPMPPEAVQRLILIARCAVEALR